MSALGTRAALVIDAGRVIVTVDGEPVTLSRKQHDLLVLLASDPERCFTQDDLALGLWGDTWKRESTIRSHISLLRRALGQRFVIGLYGVGYRLVQPGDEDLVELVVGGVR